jgi:ribose 5-phosphate isomerase B
MSARRAVTERAVREAARTGRTLEVPPGAVVTPAARDLARQLGVTLTDTAPQRAPSSSPPVPPFPGPTVAIGADHGGFPMKEELKRVLADLGCEVLDVGTHGTAAVDYPDFAIAVARAVADGKARFGVMVDGAGIGSSMAANKVAGVRAALCYDLTTAQNAREHNDANVLTLGGTLIGTRLASEIVRAFLATPFAGGRHAPRVAKINRLDEGRG